MVIIEGYTATFDAMRYVLVSVIVTRRATSLLVASAEKSLEHTAYTKYFAEGQSWTKT
jgi:hypothetical protein